jgi:hypothetical protein
MDKNMKTIHHPDFGFTILQLAHDLKMRFDRAGPRGIDSFIAACIWAGIELPEEIIDEAEAISGRPAGKRVKAALAAGEGCRWKTTRSGVLELVTQS